MRAHLPLFFAGAGLAALGLAVVVTATTTAAIAMVSVSLVLSVAFALTLGPPWLSDNPPMTWLQAMLAWVAASVDAALLVSAFGVEIPGWTVLLILLAQDVVFGWRLWLLLRRRKAQAEEEAQAKEAAEADEETKKPEDDSSLGHL